MIREYRCKPQIFQTVEQAIHDISDGSTLIVGGFGLCGTPKHLIDGIKNKQIKDLKIISNNFGLVDQGLGVLLKNRQVKRIIASYVGENEQVNQEYLAGNLELEMIPQGNLIERIRAYGAGLPAFYSPVGVDTFVETGGWVIKYDSNANPVIISNPSEVRCINGRKYLYQEAMGADVALLKAWRADKKGNLQFRYTARNFNPTMATAARKTIVEVEEMVENNIIHPDQVHLPGIYVDLIVHIPAVQPTQQENKKLLKTAHDSTNKRHRIASRAALELHDNSICNIGVGIPTLIPNYIPSDININFQSENGILGIGPQPSNDAQQDFDLVNAGKQIITTVPGTSIFSSVDSLAMIRGGHIQFTILGAMQVSRYGDLANWSVPGKSVKGPGGAMDLVSSGSKVVVVMEHLTKDGKAKIVDQCTLPLTGTGVVSRIITDLAVFDVDIVQGILTLVEIASNTTLEQIQAATGASFIVSSQCKPMPIN